MSTAVAPQAALSATDALAARTKLISCYARAFDRAVAARLVCYHNRAEDTYAVPSSSTPGEYHTVRHNGGSDWANLSCTCKGGNQPACLHRAVVAFARKNHISAALPKCPPCDDRFCGGGCPDAPVAEDQPWSVDPSAATHVLGSCDDDCNWCISGVSPQEVYGTTEEPRETPYEAPAGEDVIWEAEQAYDWESGETDEEPPLRYQYEAQEPDDSALTADEVRCIATALPNVYTPAALLAAMGSDSLTMERSLHPVQRPAPDPARWLPSAAGAITRLPVTSALDSFFS